VKIGMLGTEEVARAVADGLLRHRLRNIVLDPVLLAGGGERLFEGGFSPILPLALVLTPNLAEAEALLGHPVRDLGAMRDAARKLGALGPKVVVLKGGHLEGDPIDVLWNGETLEDLRAERIPGKRSHGTGCVFSAAIAAGLARGDAPVRAVRGAKAYVRAALLASERFGERDFLVHPPERGWSGW
jgi:hydroxymethylpyrimidine/phosphomethylpyrimidine kinase